LGGFMNTNQIGSWREGVTLWREVHSAVHHAPSTRQDVLTMLASFGAFVEDKPPAAITRLDAERYKADMVARGKAPGTVNRHVGYLRSVFNWWLSSELIAVNPFKGVRPMKAVRTRRPIVPLEDVKALLRHLDERGDRWYADLVRVVINTGLRLGEALHLKVEDVVLTERVLFVRCRKEYVPKDREARIVPLNDVAAEVFERRARSVKLGEWLFGVNGDLPCRSTVTHGLWWRSKAAGVARMNWYQMRHAFATRLCSEVSEAALAAIMGHVDPKITRENYQHRAFMALRVPTVID